MLSKPWTILALLVISAIGFWFYFGNRISPDVSPKGDKAETLAWIGLATAVTSLITSMIGIVQKLIELNGAKQNNDKENI